MMKNRAALFGIVILALIALFAILGPFISKYSSFETHLPLKNSPPGSAFWLGSDELGRDMFSRLALGVRISLLVGLATALCCLFIGVTYGSISALCGGKIDELMVRFLDLLHSIPYLLLVILIMITVGPGILSILLALIITGWIPMARIVRGQILQLKQLDYIKASKALGAGPIRILLRHLLPNCIGPILVMLTMTIPSAIFSEAFLSFLGLGIQAPAASLGTMASDGLPALRYYPHRLFLPAGLICILMLSFHMLSDALRDILDPKRRTQHVRS